MFFVHKKIEKGQQEKQHSQVEAASFNKKKSRRVRLFLFILIAVAITSVTFTFGATSSFKGSISSYNYPTSITQGSSFSIKGKVTCSTGLYCVKVGVKNTSTGKWVSSATVTKYLKGKTSFSISTVDSSIKFGSLPAGTYTYRVWAKDVNGNSKTLVCKTFTVKASSSTFKGSISSYNYPTSITQGNSFSIKGKITCSTGLYCVKVGVKNTSTGEWVSSATVTKYLSGKTSFSISTVDSSIKFSSLPAGTYTYRVWAKDMNGHSKTLVCKTFTVKASSSSFKGSISSYNYPTSLTQGSSFSIKGTVTCSTGLYSVKVGVKNVDTGEWVDAATVTKYLSGKTSFSISTVDSSIKFGSLPAGTYTYRVWAKDMNGNSKTLVCKTFTVKGSSSSFKGSISSYNYPTSLTQGSSFSIKGTVTCSTGLYSVKVGVKDVDTGEWVDTATVTKYLSGKTSFSISTVDSSIKFGSLPAGTYTYRVWAKDINGNSKTLVCETFTVTESTTTAVDDSDYEAYLLAQGFPESYIPFLLSLHESHPDWTFTAVLTGQSWADVVAAEETIGTNLVSSSCSTSWRSTDSSVYNSSTGVYTVFDGSWYQASNAVIEYYLDPRNFLTESGIYQFLDHNFSSASSTTTTITTLVSSNSSCFLNTATNITTLYTAGQAKGVNANVLAAMIIQEQGWSGTALVDGSLGVYNPFNIGAYTTSTMTALQRGAWYAEQMGWYTLYDGIVGGVETYTTYYLNSDQNTYYTKKFNVNVSSGETLGSHQYCTNVQAAYTEGLLVKKAYADDDSGLSFLIPVFTDMPEEICSL